MYFCLMYITYLNFFYVYDLLILLFVVVCNMLYLSLSI